MRIKLTAYVLLGHWSTHFISGYFPIENFLHAMHFCENPSSHPPRQFLSQHVPLGEHEFDPQ